jgi:hypothetical protein
MKMSFDDRTVRLDVGKGAIKSADHVSTGS